MVETSLALSKELHDQIEALAEKLNIPTGELFALALAAFIESHQDIEPARQPGERRQAINQGDIYWVQLPDAGGTEPGIPHPHVVVQDDVFNHSRIATVVTCALTSNVGRASLPGNVLLEAGEANLSRRSVVEVSKVSTVEKTQLGATIGSLTGERVAQILAGLRFVQVSFFTG